MSKDPVVTIHLMGGLGNQLFQIFTCISYGIQHGHHIILPYSDVLTTGITRPTYWSTLFKTIKHFSNFNNKEYSIKRLSKFSRYNEPEFKFSAIPLFDVSELQLFGYFQSAKYFQEHYTTICDLMNLPNQIVSVKNRFSQYFPEDKRTICMHFRLDDYKTIQDYHPLMPVQYYNSALSHILISRQTGFHHNILYFCQESDNDDVIKMINHIKLGKSDINFIKVDDTISDWEQLLLMANCDNNIIANSTFSWWGAYLNQNAKKTVCYPKVWFGPKAPNNVSDMFPDEWQKIIW